MKTIYDQLPQEDPRFTKLQQWVQQQQAAHRTPRTGPAGMVNPEGGTYGAVMGAYQPPPYAQPGTGPAGPINPEGGAFGAVLGGEDLGLPPPKPPPPAPETGPAGPTNQQGEIASTLGNEGMGGYGPATPPAQEPPDWSVQLQIPAYQPPQMPAPVQGISPVAQPAPLNPTPPMSIEDLVRALGQGGDGRSRGQRLAAALQGGG